MTIPRVTSPGRGSSAPACLEFFRTFRVLLLGQLIPLEDLVRARFAYERLWESNPLTESEQKEVVPGCRTLPLAAIESEPDLRALGDSLRVVELAQWLLDTPLVSIRSAHAFKQRLQRRWDYNDLGSNHWHHDVDPRTACDPIRMISVWLYLDDVTREEGATQVLLTSVPEQRRLLETGWDPAEVTRRARSTMTDLSYGTWTDGPAGGGFVWSGSLVHRMTPNRSGVPRRLVTFEFSRAGERFVRGESWNVDR